MKALQYTQRLNELTQDVANRFTDMLEQHGSVLLVKEVLDDFDSDDVSECVQEAKELGVLTDLDLREARGEVTGNVIDVYVVEVSTQGVRIVYANDEVEGDDLFKFSAFDIQDQIGILADMENLV